MQFPGILYFRYCSLWLYAVFHCSYRMDTVSMAGETGGGGGAGGTFPSGPHQFHFLGGTRGDPIYTKMGLFYFYWIAFQQLQW